MICKETTDTGSSFNRVLPDGLLSVIGLFHHQYTCSSFAMFILVILIYRYPSRHAITNLMIDMIGERWGSGSAERDSQVVHSITPSVRPHLVSMSIHHLSNTASTAKLFLANAPENAS